METLLQGSKQMGVLLLGERILIDEIKLMFPYEIISQRYFQVKEPLLRSVMMEVLLFGGILDMGD